MRADTRLTHQNYKHQALEAEYKQNRDELVQINTTCNLQKKQLGQHKKSLNDAQELNLRLQRDIKSLNELCARKHSELVKSEDKIASLEDEKQFATQRILELEKPLNKFNN